MRTNDAVDGSRRLNSAVLAGLSRGRIVWGYRRTGKTITLLTYIAAHRFDSPHTPIVVGDTKNFVDTCLRHMWRVNFPDIPEPRWMSYRTFLEADGLTGDVYVDEPRISWNMDRFFRHADACAARANSRVCGVTS